MAKVLVTGGAGFIGSHTCKALAAAGHIPVVYDSLERGHKSAVLWGPLETGNLLDTERLIACIHHHEPSAIVHFAAYAYVGESTECPGLYYLNNVGGTASLVEAMRRTGLRAAVFSSTCAIYGTPAYVPVAEACPPNPLSPYGRSKKMAEDLFRDAETAHGVRTVRLRYFNAAGADPDGEIGERHDPETHAIPLAILAMLGHAPAFRLFGTDYDTPDGSAVRDYIHVMDLASAHVAALDHLLAGGGSLDVNLGTGTGHSVREILSAIKRVSGRRVPVEINPRRAGDPSRLVADNGRARRLLGWFPQRAGIETIVADALHWFAKTGGNAYWPASTRTSVRTTKATSASSIPAWSGSDSARS
ncbi:MAG TPA: UDP-glucose 4-epimerase GalE [Azospirillaceae bacterium]|nr:UDP-glucose 4-epimerase GalE [Azospirillaceae bacterium]